MHNENSSYRALHPADMLWVALVAEEESTKISMRQGHTEKPHTNTSWKGCCILSLSSRKKKSSRQLCSNACTLYTGSEWMSGQGNGCQHGRENHYSSHSSLSQKPSLIGRACHPSTGLQVYMLKEHLPAGDLYS